MFVEKNGSIVGLSHVNFSVRERKFYPEQIHTDIAFDSAYQGIVATDTRNPYTRRELTYYVSYFPFATTDNNTYYVYLPATEFNSSNQQTNVQVLSSPSKQIIYPAVRSFPALKSGLPTSIYRSTCFANHIYGNDAYVPSFSDFEDAGIATPVTFLREEVMAAVEKEVVYVPYINFLSMDEVEKLFDRKFVDVFPVDELEDATKSYPLKRLEGFFRTSEYTRVIAFSADRCMLYVGLI